MSSLGDLLLGKPEVREKPSSPKIKDDHHHQQQHRQKDVIDDENNKIRDDSVSRDAESFTNVQKVFPERTVVKKDNNDDDRSNASSTDDYVRELLDPNDRPRNVWHVVEGPQEEKHEGTDDSEHNRDRNAPSTTYDDCDDVGGLETFKYDRNNDRNNDNNISPDEQKQQQQQQQDSRDTDYKPASPPVDSGNGPADDKPIERHNRDKSSSSSHRRSHHRDRHSDRDRRDDPRDKHRHRDLDDDNEGQRRHRSDGDKSSQRSRRRYDYSDDDDEDGDDVDLRDRHRRRHHHRRSSRSRSRSLSKSSSSRRRDRSRSGSQSPVTRRNSRTILVMQLSPRVRTRDLEVFFKDLGRVREVRLIMDGQTRRHKGIAYIEFEDAKTATKALASNGQKLCGVPMVIQSALLDNNKSKAAADWHTSTTYKYNNNNNSTNSSHHHHHTSSHSSSRSNLPPNCYRVYVGSLHVALTEEMIRSVFEPFGPIIKVELMKDRATGVSKGYAFLTYANIEDGQEAVRCLDGFELAGKNLRVSKSTEKSDH